MLNPNDYACGDEDRTFLRERVHAIPGWLHDYAALRSMELMRWQALQGYRGCAFEIGVYAGRFLAVLLREASAAGEVTVGLDTFERVDEPALRRYLGLPSEAAQLSCLHGRSIEYDASRLAASLPAPPRFVSIDGSHLVDDVRHDLAISEAVLPEHGMIACDDFLNPVRFGVGQAVHEALAAGIALVPFAHIQNKLFLCRPAFHRPLFDLTLSLCAGDQSGAAGELFAAEARDDPSRNRTRLYGWDLVVVP